MFIESDKKCLKSRKLWLCRALNQFFIAKLSSICSYKNLRLSFDSTFFKKILVKIVLTRDLW